MSLVLGVIPARAGSKRLPGKNKKPFHGMPMWMWSVMCAWACDNMNDFIVTTDDTEILATCRNAKIPYIQRWKDLATDDASMRDVCLDAAMRYLVDNPMYQQHHSFSDIWVALLQPTSPVRDFAKINNYIYSIERGEYGQQAAFATGKPDGKDDFLPNGEFYCASLRHLIKKGLHIDDYYYLDPTTPMAVDIDTQEDYETAVKEGW